MADVLLVEDDPLQRAFASKVLTGAGHAVREAEDGASALALAHVRRPDLVVSDVVMPGMNGYQLVAALRADPVLCTVPAMLLTSLDGRAQVRTGMNAGADDYLAKPVRPGELLEAVDALLSRRRAQDEAITSRMLHDLDAALAQQREQLATEYEQVLLREVDSRWRQDLEASHPLTCDRAGVLVADVFGEVAHRPVAADDAAALLTRVHQAASDALYLFGAQHVLHHGDDILGVFDGSRSGLLPSLRASFAMQAAVEGVLGRGHAPAAGISLGPVSLVRLRDPLHGDAGIRPVPGPTLARAQALRALARSQGWVAAVPADAQAMLPPGWGAAGRSLPLPGSAGSRALEITRPHVEPLAA